MNALITDYNLLVGIAGIIVGAFVAWLAMSQNRRIATESGAFKKAVPSIYFLKKDIFKNPIDSTYWVLLCPKDAESAVYSLSFQIANEGDAALDCPVFTVQAPKFCIPNLEGIAKLDCVPGVFQDTIKRSMVNLGNFNQISYMLPFINVNTAAELTDCFHFGSTTNVPFAREMTFKDGEKAKVNFEYSFSVIFSLGLLTKDYPLVHCDLRMMCLPADTIEEAIGLLAKGISKKQNGKKENYVFLHFPIDKKHKYKGEYKYLMKGYTEKGFSMKAYRM